MHKYKNTTTKYTNTQVQHTKKCQKDPTYGIFLKRKLFKDIKNYIPLCRTNKYTNAQIQHMTKCQKDPTCGIFMKRGFSELSVYRQCIISASSAHYQCIISVSSVHHQRIISASSAHQQCIIAQYSLLSWAQFTVVLFTKTHCISYTKPNKISQLQVCWKFSEESSEEEDPRLKPCQSICWKPAENERWPWVGNIICSRHIHYSMNTYI